MFPGHVNGEQWYPHRKRHERTVSSPTNLLGERRPSWTPSLPESAEYGYRGTRKSTSTSRTRSRFDENQPLDAASALPASLLTARRPILASSLPEAHDRLRVGRRRLRQGDTSLASEMQKAADIPEALIEPPSPKDEGKFQQSLQIDMKDLVGDAVGNMSISPASRDVVLAARRGLFIIDLEDPTEVPRFLPQGGTWDVADVQWNPHPSRSEYIVSTSSEKLLIWNLLLGGKTSIEHILRSHYRAITDINWHTTERDTVISTGIDSWLWAWDLREPHKPIFGLSAFNSGGTQVKWNRQDPNILASSHSNEVFIWDRRKGSLPVSRIRAHNSKIYGIDWSYCIRNQIVTCSLDKSIKTWDINDSTKLEGTQEPKSVIWTTYPVWRARNLPFGQGILSLPQRGETALEMYAKDEPIVPIETFEGHTDVVKEFVWRKGNQDEFQLITWSKDRTLRFWPVDHDTMERVGHAPNINHDKQGYIKIGPTVSFRNPPEITEYVPALSAPVGARSILAEVRAPLPPRSQNPVMQPHQGSAARAEQLQSTPTASSTTPIAMTALRKRGETMSRGNFGGKSVGRMDALSWLSNVKLGSRRGSSSGHGSGGDNSAAASQIGSRSRPTSGPDRVVLEARKRSDSRSRALDDKKESENNQSLQDEITSVLNKLASSKIKLEKHDLTKKRTCTLGLHGPWGESSSVFIRITFTFPRDYPHGTHPEGTPTVDLERNPLISMKDRAFMLRRLRSIRERKRPCLESCLRFLLFGDEGEQQGRPYAMDSESSSDEDDNTSVRKSKEVTVSLLRNNKNLAEPRTSQGTFGPNGELILFFRAPPRIVRNVLRGVSDTISNPQEEQPVQQVAEPQPRLFQSPALVSDAVRRLGLAATDRVLSPGDNRKAENGNILRIMTNLLTVAQQQKRRDSDSKAVGDISKNYGMLPTRRSTVFLTSTRNVAGGDKIVAAQYIYESSSLADVCEKNAAVARRHRRFDHERIFRIIGSLFRNPCHDDDKMKGSKAFESESLASRVVIQVHSDLAKSKDIQMLAMLSMLVLQTTHVNKLKAENTVKQGPYKLPDTPKLSGLDYFTLTRSINNISSPTSPTWPRLPSSAAPPLTASISSSNSSRGSWSSLFNTGSMRQFVAGVQDTLKEGLTTPSEIVFSHSEGRQRKDSHLVATTVSGSTISKSWNETSTAIPSKPPSVSFFSAGSRRPTVSHVPDPYTLHEKRSINTEIPLEEKPDTLFDSALITQFVSHVYVYSEMLFGWQLYNQRLELLKSVKRQNVAGQDYLEDHKIGIKRACRRCGLPVPEKDNICTSCGVPTAVTHCTICRLPVKGLSRSCMQCYHVTHISCWNSLDVPICPSGCGCFCNGMDSGTHGSHFSTRAPFSPPSAPLILS